VLIAGLTTAHKIAMLAASGSFIAFALLSSFVFPRRNPDYPGKGLGLFVVVAIAFTVLMLGAVELFAVEQAKPGEGAGAEKHQIQKP
jgi:hypothetical protein